MLWVGPIPRRLQWSEPISVCRSSLLYYVSVKASNASGLWSQVGTSIGVRPDIPPVFLPFVVARR